ncbi:MAG TPA: PHB depolymerase family esterase [Gemmatimonadaceae bacterium]|jgi:phospholipase/carboxylesterase
MRELSPVSRREFLRLGTLAGLTAATGATVVLPKKRVDAGRLEFRPHKATKTTSPGEYVLADEEGRRTLLYVPPTYDPSKPAPFLLALHGATGSGESMLRGTRPAAEKHGVIVLAPSSRDFTWDAIRGTFSVDFVRIDKTLSAVFDQCAIDPRRLGVVGFSDGATYALSVGLINGDIFTHIIGHSAGFIVPGPVHGRPKVYLSHGHQDTVLPFDQCGRRIADQLTHQAYVLRFDEFEGGHAASPEIREAAMSWFVGEG